MAPLNETQTKKIILTALLTPSSGPALIKATCTFTSKPLRGPVYECGQMLGQDLTDMALYAAEQLSDQVPSESPAEIWSAAPTSQFRQKILELAQCMLCDAHRSPQAVAELSHRCIASIALAVSAEKEAAERICADLLHAARQETTLRNQASQQPRRPTTSRPVHNPTTKNARDDVRQEQVPTGTKRKGREDFQSKSYQPLSAEEQEESILPWPPIERIKKQRPRFHDDYERRWNRTCPWNVSYKSAQDLIKRFPWPMAFVHPDGISELGVRLFYEHAVKESDLTSREYFRREKLKWHPDRIDLKFKGGCGKTELRRLATVIFRTLSAVEQEFKPQEEGDRDQEI